MLREKRTVDHAGKQASRMVTKTRRNPGRPIWRHWWREDPALRLTTGAGLSPDTRKAACTFEGLRRREEVLISRKLGKLPAGWQIPTSLCFAWWELSWVELNEEQRAEFISAIRSPFYLPPVGFSFFPDDNQEVAKAHALQPLEVPDNEEADAAIEFVRHCRRLVAAGFTLAGVDTKTMKSIRRAAMALEDRPRTFRQADVRFELLEQLGKKPDRVSLSASASFRLEGFKLKDGRWTASKRLHFFAICEQFERLDNRRIPSEFVNALRV